MPRQALAGSRIRERRTAAGLRQADLAREVGISASYLNLIEHNRRNVGAALLRRIAEVLKLDPAQLSEGAGAALLAGLREAVSGGEGGVQPTGSAGEGPAGPGAGEGRSDPRIAEGRTGEARTGEVRGGGEPGPAEPPVVDGPELDRIEEFVGRFPGWAGLLARLQGRVAHLERSVEILGDRLAHDPTLSASLHDILSAVTALRSTAAILAETDDLEPEWRARFHANLEGESVRLAEGAEALVAYLDAPRTREAGQAAPQELFEEWLGARGYHLAELEGTAPAAPETLAPELPAAARRLVVEHARRYAADAARLPMAALLPALAEIGPEPGRLAERFGQPLPVIFRRLAALPEGEGLPRLGLVACDGSGALTFRKPAEGFVLPRFGPGCPLWPLYQALSRPMAPIRAPIQMTGRGQRRYLSYAVCQPSHPGGFDGPQVVASWMLMLPEEGAGSGPAQAVGTSCRICPRAGCPARREPSILGAEA
ncbi:helix-turn-helix transcriptional regulator [Acidimangrovimonas sediminis]|uniref:helix-turn-helix transcriptional regulator n=1 Tax=Acidimangrovimonas sediminis TaxID=2056283 RepID=UPI000C80F354|nr:helix-turn-helix transcriptional regulator [Acidimangrovimonas sediminis]